MISDSQTELRLFRLGNDRDSLYELLAAISGAQREHSRRFDEVGQRFDGANQRFDSVEATLAEVVRRLPESA